MKHFDNNCTKAHKEMQVKDKHITVCFCPLEAGGNQSYSTTGPCSNLFNLRQTVTSKQMQVSFSARVTTGVSDPSFNVEISWEKASLIPMAMIKMHWLATIGPPCQMVSVGPSETHIFLSALFLLPSVSLYSQWDNEKPNSGHG